MVGVFTTPNENLKKEIKMPENIQLFNENCIKTLQTIPDNSIDLICTDPPYCISATNGGGYSKQY